MLRFHRLTDNYLVFENYAHGRYALNGRIRITCLFTLLLWTVDSSVLTILSYAYPF